MVDLSQYQKIGCVGSRDVTLEQRKLCFFIGHSLATLGKHILSGNATGADFAFAEGANAVNPSLVTLYLPLKNHNLTQIHPANVVIYEHEKQWSEIARSNHVRYDFLKPYVKLLFNRNAGIVANADLLIAFPGMDKNNCPSGGTAHDLRIAEQLKIPYLNIAEKEVAQHLINYLKSQLYLETEITHERTREN